MFTKRGLSRKGGFGVKSPARDLIIHLSPGPRVHKTRLVEKRAVWCQRPGPGSHNPYISRPVDIDVDISVHVDLDVDVDVDGDIDRNVVIDVEYTETYM